MIKISNLKVSVEELRKYERGFGGWIELKHKFVINNSIILENECDLLIPLEKFSKDAAEFMHDGRDTIQIDPNGGALDISVIKHKEDNLKLIIRKNSYLHPEVLAEGIIDKDYFLLTMIAFYYKSLDFLIPSDSRDKEFLKNLKKSLKKLKNEIIKSSKRKIWVR